MVAIKAFEQLATVTDFVPQMLFFCAVDAQNQGKKALGFSVLKEILRHHDTMSEDSQKEIRLPILFR